MAEPEAALTDAELASLAADVRRAAGMYGCNLSEADALLDAVRHLLAAYQALRAAVAVLEPPVFLDDGGARTATVVRCVYCDARSALNSQVRDQRLLVRHTARCPYAALRALLPPTPDPSA